MKASKKGNKSKKFDSQKQIIRLKKQNSRAGEDISCLDLSGKQLSDDELQELFSKQMDGKITNCKSKLSIQLQGNNLTDQSLSHLAKFLDHQMKNTVERKPSKSLKKKSKQTSQSLLEIVELNLSQNRIQGHGFSYLCLHNDTVLKSIHQNLRKLNVSWNELSGDLQWIGFMIKDCQSLKYVNLSCNQISSTGIKQIILSSKGKIARTHTLLLHVNNIHYNLKEDGNYRSIYFIDDNELDCILFSNQIEELTLGNNSIQDYSMMKLSYALSRPNSLSSLNRLDLSATSISLRSMYHLASGIIFNNNVLNFLDLSHNDFSLHSPCFEYCIGSIIENSAKLKDLKLNDCKLKDGIAIAKFCVRTNVEQLNLMNNDLDYLSFEEFSDTMNRISCKLKCVNLSGNQKIQMASKNQESKTIILRKFSSLKQTIAINQSLSIPEEIWLIIISFFDCWTLSSFSQVCQMWYRLTNSEEFWRYKCTDYGIFSGNILNNGQEEVDNLSHGEFPNGMKFKKMFKDKITEESGFLLPVHLTAYRDILHLSSNMKNYKLLYDIEFRIGLVSYKHKQLTYYKENPGITSQNPNTEDTRNSIFKVFPASRSRLFLYSSKYGALFPLDFVQYRDLDDESTKLLLQDYKYEGQGFSFHVQFLTSEEDSQFPFVLIDYCEEETVCGRARFHRKVKIPQSIFIRQWDFFANWARLKMHLQKIRGWHLSWMK